jgi:hypothetical protein
MPKKFYQLENNRAVGRTREMIWISTPEFTEENEKKVRKIFREEMKPRKVKCAKCGKWKESKGAWCPNYRSHGRRYPVRQKRFVHPPAQEVL